MTSSMHPQRLAPGMEVDGFLVGDKVHVGGMATLWRVTKPGLDMPLVMKVPLLRFGENPATIVGFEVETMLLPRLAGRHVPKFVAAGDFDQPYIVMEYIGGPSLKEQLDHLPLPWPEVVAIGARIATALHDLHRQHVVHLDLKPSNVILRPSGDAVLIDFGFSRHDRLPDLLDEEFHVPIGTGPYISPEQVKQNRGDPRSDLYALGVMMYFFVTGERPFGDPQKAREWRRRLWKDPVPPRVLAPDCPPWLQEVILRCLEVDPGRRHASAAQLAFDLTHPDKVRLTARAERTTTDGFLTVLRRRFAVMRKGQEVLAVDAPPPTRTVSGQLARAPIIVAAVDLTPGLEPLTEALRVAVRRVIATEPDARLACVNVLKGSRLALDEFEDEDGRNMHLRRLAELEHWARPLGLAAGHVTYHVLEKPDIVAALIEYVTSNHVDHVLMGARGASAVRRYLGSVSAQVVAQAPCTVTVVRTAAEREAPPGPDAVT